MKKTDKANELIGGAVSLTVSALIVKFLGLIYKIPLSYILTEEGMGYFNSAYTVYTFFYLICTAGVPKAISILTSEAMGEGNLKKSNAVYSGAIKLFAIFGGSITVIFMLSAGVISDLIGNHNTFLSMLAIAPSVFFVCIGGVIRGALNGRLSFLPVAISEVISGGLRVGLGLLLAYLGYRAGASFEVISALTILGTTIGSLLALIYLWIYNKSNKTDVILEQNGYNYINEKSLTRRIVRICIPLTLTSAIGSLSGIIDLSIIMRRLQSSGFSELQAGMLYGNYTTLVIPMLNLAATLIAPLSAILLPTVSRRDVKFDKGALSDRLSLSLFASSMIATPIVVIYVKYGEAILSLLFDSSGAAMAAPLLALISPGILFMALLTVVNTTLEAMEKTHIPLISMLIGAVLKLVIGYFLIARADYGIFGAPIGTTASYIVSFLISYIYLTFVLGVNVKLMKSLAVAVAISLVASFISDALSGLISSNVGIFSLSAPLFFGGVYAILGTIYFICASKIKKRMSIYTKKETNNY